MKRKLSLLFSYKGKLNRREYLFALFLFALYAITSLFTLFLLLPQSNILFSLLLLSYLIAAIAIQHKRCKDAGVASGWILLSLIPYIR